MNKWCEKEIEEMLDLVSKTKTVKDVRKIFDIILTPREINDMARRLKIIQLIEDGVNHSDISMVLGVSTSTISKVSGKIGYGFRRTNAKLLAKNNRMKSPLKIEASKICYKGAPIYKISLNHD